MSDLPPLTRRELIHGGVALAAAAGWLPGWARAQGLATTLSGEDITLTVAHQMARVGGRTAHAIAINGVTPGPLIRLREGQRVRLTVDNRLDEDTSIHWHGLLVPFHMDGVPGVSFPGIGAGRRFTYEFPIVQAGTYWYHSHSGLQEQIGHYGPLVIDPAGTDPIASDREHVIMLSDHSPMHPHMIFKKLKQQGGYFNWQKQTLGGQLAGRDQKGAERRDWGRMRMDPTDIADVTGRLYTYLLNGHAPADNWTGLFEAGQRLRLRVINASAMTTFNLRIPGLTLTVAAADGLSVRPVQVDELQVAVAETYDLLVEPAELAYDIVAETVDRSGMAVGTLAPRLGMRADVPALRRRPLATMKDMGMGGMGDASCPPEHAAMGHCTPGGAPMTHSMRDFANAPEVKRTPVVQTVSPMPVDRMGEPGQGLADVGHKVLTYRDLVARDRNPDVRNPSRELRIHLTGNMERYMWAFDGVKLSEVTAPIAFTQGERVRLTLVNDTMMGHPIHLHGHYFELVTGHGDHAPRKHTIQVQPGGTATFDLTADAPGDWAFHCHMLYHMHAGMMQVVSVRPA